MSQPTAPTALDLTPAGYAGPVMFLAQAESLGDVTILGLFRDLDQALATASNADGHTWVDVLPVNVAL